MAATQQTYTPMPVVSSNDANENEEDSGRLPDNITGQCVKSLGGKEVVGTEKDLDENAYGAAAVALVREVTNLQLQCKKGELQIITVTRLCSSVGIMVANLFLQLLLLNYIGSYVVEPAVRHVQLLYSEFHTQVFDAAGHIDSDVWADWELKDQVCQITMADRTFYYIILLLWALRILDELRKINRCVDDICYCPYCPKSDEMLQYTEDPSGDGSGACLITHLTGLMRWLLLSVVILPRSFIAVRLLVLGCRWLSASPTFPDMVLNALALVFVTDIDELLYSAILPAALKKQIADTNFFFEEQPKTKEMVDRQEWRLYLRTCIWLSLTVIFLFTYGEYLQTVLPNNLVDLRNHCAQFMMENQEPLCSAPSWMGHSQQCYPYNDHHLAGGLAAGHRMHHAMRQPHPTNHMAHAAHAHGHGHGR